MHIIIAAIGLLTAIYVLFIRTRNAGHVAADLTDMANDVRLAARRFGFKRQTNIHPVETIEDPKLAVGAIATAFLELDDLPTREQRDALQYALRDTYDLGHQPAEEMTILGHWFVSECGGAEQAVTRLARKLYKLDGANSFDPLLSILNTTMSAGSGALNRAQGSALDEVKRAFRIS
ncbi:hypothetical protein [Roseovarius sp. 2305UL8-3]|uniref:hypothetical protein n=1 Tax=Roseovarius conchicola TaxID=3121636 RepID=UPI0035297105